MGLADHALYIRRDVRTRMLYEEPLSSPDHFDVKVPRGEALSARIIKSLVHPPQERVIGPRVQASGSVEKGLE